MDPTGSSIAKGSGSVIEVFGDMWCPFTHAGLRMIHQQRSAAGRTDMVIWVRAWPLELVNGHPLDPRTTRDHAQDLREQVTPNLFSHFDIARFPSSTIEALALANRAYATDAHTGERISLAIRDALFEEGQDISDPMTLKRIGGMHGVAMPDKSDRDGVVADWHEGQRRGVLGSPHFFCGDENAFCPSLDITKDDLHHKTTITFNSQRVCSTSWTDALLGTH